MKKLILLILVGAFLLLSLIGCNVSKSPIETPESTIPEGITPEGTTPENTTPENTTPENTPQETTTPENSTTENTPPQNNNLPAPNENGLFSNRSGTVVMEVLAQIPVSSYYGVEVEMADDGKIYINDILYENIGVFATPELAYLEPIPYIAQQDEKLAEILQKIQSTQSCYVLETQGVERYGKKISVYYIDDTYYFLNKYDGNVSRIWYEDKTVEPTPENPPVNNIVPAPNGANPFGNVQTSFTAEIFAQNALMSSRFSLEVRIDNDKIYLGKTLYSCFGIFKNPTVTYSEYLLQDIEFDEDAGEKMKVLEKIKNSETCYMLKPVESDSAKTIMLYYIDGVYYFSDSVDGKPSRIHYAITDIPQ